MKNYDKKEVSTGELFPLIKEVINHGHKARFTVSGNSMRPWIVDDRDQVLLTGSLKARLGDIILFQNTRGNYVLHRIMKKEKDGYHTMGDSCIKVDDDLIFSKDIIGVVEIIYRKGKEIDCNSFLWRFIFTLWRLLLPFRKILLKLYYVLIRMNYEIADRKNSLGA